MTTMKVEILHVPTMEAGTEFRAKFPTHSKWDVHPGQARGGGGEAQGQRVDNGWTTGGSKQSAWWRVSMAYDPNDNSSAPGCPGLISSKSNASLGCRVWMSFSEIIPSQTKCCHESNMLQPENQNNRKSIVAFLPIPNNQKKINQKSSETTLDFDKSYGSKDLRH